MTKQEFIQVAVLRMISARPNEPTAVIDVANSLADRLFPEKKEEEPQSISDPIEVLIKEIERIEQEEMQKLYDYHNKEYPDWRWPSQQKSGLPVRILHGCQENNIETVGDLINYGRARFQKNSRNVGKLCLDKIDKALKKLYGINVW